MEKQENVVEITVLNWEKYQPASDRVRHPHWFRLNRDAANSHGLAGLSAAQCWVWIQILSECCRKKSGTVRINIIKLAHICLVEKELIFEAIEILSQNETVSFRTVSQLSVNCQYTAPIMQIAHPTGQDRTGQDKQISLEPSSRPTADALLDNLSFEARDRLKKLYPETAFIDREIIKMEIWLSTNRHKTPRSSGGWARFVMRWLEKGWEFHRRGLPSKKTGSRLEVRDV